MTTTRIRAIPVLCCAAFLISGAAGCSRAVASGAAAGSGAETFRGVYEAGPDRSAFVPCGSGEQWYVSPETVPARELRRLTHTQDVLPPGGGMIPAERSAVVRRAYAEVRGDTVAVPAGGPALTYERELRVTRVLAVRPAQGGVCPSD